MMGLHRHSGIEIPSVEVNTSSDYYNNNGNVRHKVLNYVTMEDNHRDKKYFTKVIMKMMLAGVCALSCGGEARHPNSAPRWLFSRKE